MDRGPKAQLPQAVPEGRRSAGEGGAVGNEHFGEEDQEEDPADQRGPQEHDEEDEGCRYPA